MKILLFTLLFISASASFAQFNDSRVTLIAEEEAKRTNLYVQNNTDKDLNIFLKIDGNGYRRSSDRPLITDIPANTKVFIKTLIPLTNESSSYTYLLVVNDEEKPIDVESGKRDPELDDFDLLLSNDLVVFTKDDCPRCDIMINLLSSQHTPHKVINVDDRKRYYDALYVLLKIEQEGDYAVKMPIVRKQGTMIYPIWDVKKMAKDLGAEFKE